MVQDMSRMFVEGGLEWSDLIYMAVLLFLFWTLVIMTGFLAVILARTVLVKSRFAGVLAVVLFFVIFFVIERAYDLLQRIPVIASAGILGVTGWNIWDFVFYILVALILFGVSGLLAEKKLSV